MAPSQAWSYVHLLRDAFIAIMMSCWLQQILFRVYRVGRVGKIKWLRLWRVSIKKTNTIEIDWNTWYFIFAFLSYMLRYFKSMCCRVVRENKISNYRHVHVFLIYISLRRLAVLGGLGEGLGGAGEGKYGLPKKYVFLNCAFARERKIRIG